MPPGTYVRSPETRAKISATLRGNQRPLTHGHAARGRLSPTYHSWRNMRTRCRNLNYTGYKYWGGRGIKVCERWDSFENFLADMGEKPEGLSIDRINNELGYDPFNCRWATPKEQAQNRRIERGEQRAAQ